MAPSPLALSCCVRVRVYRNPNPNPNPNPSPSPNPPQAFVLFMLRDVQKVADPKYITSMLAMVRRGWG